MKNFFLFILVGSLLPLLALASEPSLRRCAILPITDNMDGTYSYGVFERVERYLKNSPWCYYRSNSEVVEVLTDYQKNLKDHLQSPEVVQLIAKKVRSGTIIRADIERVSEGVDIKLDILDANGVDIYLSERVVQKEDTLDMVSQTIINWLELYEKQIPYDGKIVGILGDQFTIDIGKAYLVKMGQQVNIYRSLGKKRHPLLKKVVEWNSELLAKGQLFNVSDKQAQGLIKIYMAKKKLQLGDWVRIVRNTQSEVDPNDFPEVDKKDFGTLGSVRAYLTFGLHSATSFNSSNSGNSELKIGGPSYGIDFIGNMFVTRKYWVGFNLGKDFSSLSQKNGNLNKSEYDSATERFSLKAGYKYLPLGFFYGPSVDGYLGYSKYTYDTDFNSTDGFGYVSFSGIIIGLAGEFPFMPDYRIRTAFEFMASPGYTEKEEIYGGPDSKSNFKGEVGVIYSITKNYTLDIVYELLTSKAKFSSPDQELKFSNNTLKIGTSFNF